MACIKLLSLNCRGLNSYDKRVLLYDWLNSQKCDIIFLQETHFVDKKQSIYDARWHGSAFHNFSESSHSKGVSIFFHKNFTFKTLNIHKSADSRILVMNIEHDNNIITLVNVYAPNSENERVNVFKKVAKWISQYAMNEENLILVGDFNCNVKSEKDKSGKTVRDIIQRFDLVDLWSTLKPDKNCLTWCDGNGLPKSRIDYVIASKHFCYAPENIFLRKAPNVNNCRMSDHLSIVFKFRISCNTKGGGFWKLNVSVLHDTKYVKAMNGFLNNLPNEIENEMNPHIKWELIKIHIRDLSINFCKQKGKSIRDKILTIEKEIEEIESGDYALIDIKKKRELESELDELYTYKAKGAQIRSRATWIDKGEKNTSYFLRLENKHQSHNVINRINNNGQTYTETNEILEQLCLFYDNLYSSKQVPDKYVDNYLSEINLENKLTDEDREIFEKFPTEKECAEAVFHMKQNKSPGNDGIPVEFYKMFWKHLKTHYYNALIYSFEQGELSTTQKCSILSLIFKKGSLDKLENYRPISLTNIDYKIIAFVFAKRLQNVMDNIINENQTGYIKGRFIGNNSRLILDMLKYSENNDKECILLFADFHKAFDSIEWNFLFKTLKKIQFRAKFYKMDPNMLHKSVFLCEKQWLVVKKL